MKEATYWIRDLEWCSRMSGPGILEQEFCLTASGSALNSWVVVDKRYVSWVDVGNVGYKVCRVSLECVRLQGYITKYIQYVLK